MRLRGATSEQEKRKTMSQPQGGCIAHACDRRFMFSSMCLSMSVAMHDHALVLACSLS